MKEVHAKVKDTDKTIVYLEYDNAMSSTFLTALMALNVVIAYLTWGVPYAIWFAVGIAGWQGCTYVFGKIIGELKTRCSFQRGVIEMMTAELLLTLKDHAPTPDGTNADDTCLTPHEGKDNDQEKEA